MHAYNALPELATRVVDVGDAGSSSSLKLVCTIGPHAQYVALSHCWGGKVETVLLEEDVQSF